MNFFKLLKKFLYLKSTAKKKIIIRYHLKSPKLFSLLCLYETKTFVFLKINSSVVISTEDEVIFINNNNI